MGFIILAKLEEFPRDITYINSIASYETHLAIEADLKPGKYLIFCDVNYRYNAQNHGYTITCYHNKTKGQLKLQNVTEEIEKEGNLTKYLEGIIYNYCIRSDNVDKEKLKGIRDLYVYSLKKNNQKFPFDFRCFENLTNNTYEIEVEIKNGKSCCIYNEGYENEKKTKITKEIKSQTKKAILVMRYNEDSIFDIKYNKITLRKLAKNFI